MSLTIGIDVGGTKIAGGLVDEQGTVLARTRRESPAADAEAIEDTIGDLVEELRQGQQVEAVGVGAAGYIDNARSTVRFAPNLAWRDVDLKGELEARLDLPVVVENDANAAAWGEFQFGAGHDVEDLLLVTVGTGVGGGVVLDGNLLRGGFGIAAEVGHLRGVPNGRECGCGNFGCLESYASGTALVDIARARLDLPEAASLHELVAGDPEALTGPMITEAAQGGDLFAIAQLADLGHWLGEGVASLAAVLDPEVVVVGGGVSAAGDLLLEPTREGFARQLSGRGHRPEAEFRLATLGNGAGMIGAADLARHRA